VQGTQARHLWQFCFPCQKGSTIGWVSPQLHRDSRSTKCGKS